MFRLTIEGFQSIKDPVTIDVEGLTVITGESNIGKSAVIRALMALLTNKTGNSFINSACTKCRIMLEIDGHEIVWEKTPTSAEYLIDGQKYTKLKGNIPEPLTKLGFNGIEVNKDVFWSQLHRQIDTPFILGETPTTAAALLGVNRESLLVSRAIKVAQKDLLAQRAEEDLLGRQTAELGAKGAELAPQLKSLEGRLTSLTTLEQRISDLKQKISQLEKVQVRYDALQPKVTLRIPPIPTYPDVKKQIRLCDLGYLYGQIKRFDLPLPHPPGVVPVTVLSECSILVDLQARFSKVSQISTLEFMSIPERREYDGLATKLSEYFSVHRKLGEGVELSERELERIEADQISTDREIVGIRTDLGVCPTCGESFSTCDAS